MCCQRAVGAGAGGVVGGRGVCATLAAHFSIVRCAAACALQLRKLLIYCLMAPATFAIRQQQQQQQQLLFVLLHWKLLIENCQQF